MADKAPQDFENHSRIVPGYHIVAAILLLLNFGYAGWALLRSFSFGNIVALTTAIALILVFYYARAFALAVQDRVIRLEERIRLQRLLPQELQSRIDEFTTGQLVALRFAGDAELATLATRALDENVRDRKTIKTWITNWRPDYCRA